jgi:uncharacterized membrane protein YbhN (UPF0104 family)
LNRYRRLFAVLQVLGSAILLWLVLRQVDLATLVSRVGLLAPWRVGLAFVVFIASYITTVGVWQVVLRALDVRLPFGQVLRAHLAGYFYGTVIPSSLSSDVGRGLRLHAEAKLARPIALSIIIDRITGTVVFGIVFLVMTPIYLRQLPFAFGEVIARWPIWGGLVVIGLLAIVVIVRLFADRFAPYLSWMRRRWRAFLLAVGLSFVVHLLVAVMLWLLILPYWESASLAFSLYLTELSQIAEILPISVAGLGVREGLYVVMLEPLGVARADAVTVALVQFALFVLWALVGGAVELVGGVRRLRTP